MIRRIAIFSFLLFFATSAMANECKDMAKNIVSLDDRVKNSSVNPALIQSWQAKLKEMRGEFTDDKCDPQLLSNAEKTYNDKRK